MFYLPELKLGRRQELIERELARIARGRWLRPDAALESLDEGALGWLADRLDELLAALAPWADEELPTSLALRVTRSTHEAEAVWRAAWEGADVATPGAALRALDRADRALTRAVSTRARRKRRAIGAHASYSVGLSLERLLGLTQRVSSKTEIVPVVADVGLSRLAARHAEWLLAHGEGVASPFGPLLDLWLRGAWPVLLPGDAALVYVPLVQDDRVVVWLDGDPVNPAPEAPEVARHGPRRRPIAAEQSGALPAWWALGVSRPLTFEVEVRRVEVAGGIGAVGDDPPDYGDDESAR